MEARAFCPAHVTGFFKAEAGGSLGAGFSVELGVATAVRASEGRGTEIRVRGREPGDLRVSRRVAGRFRQVSGFAGKLEITHEIGVPVGYGLGCSAAAALSLAYALDAALETGLGAQESAKIAHEAELECRTGLGDVLAAYHGGFEIRVSAGAPGSGRIVRMPSDGLAAVIACFAPIPTTEFIKNRMAGINGLGGRMVRELLRGGGASRFQEMSLEFADYIDVVTPRMRRAVRGLQESGRGCGVAMFGETVFALVPEAEAGEAGRALSSEHPGAEVLQSRIDGRGARLLAAGP